MRFSQSFLDEVRDRVPISDVIGQRVTWDKRKTNTSRGDWWACCPFHGEKTPSFHCEDKKGRYHCFGCGVSGDHFRFLTELDGMNFPEAVERVASMAGIALPAPDPEAEKRERQRATLYDVAEAAAKFFETQLQLQPGAAARAYLRDRGLTLQTIGKFRLGYAPSSRNALKEHLAQGGATKEQIEACGLVVHGDDIAVSYDRFRDRIIFPIEDAQGRVIAFGGRAMSADVPAKYLNSPEGPLFHKSDVLYNFRRARQTTARGGTLVVVEGYMDVIALDQAGFSNAVAPLGTALTESQLAKIWRVASEPVLCFDGDQAGLRAAYRSLDLALPELKPGKSVRFALLPDGKDPDDLIKADGAAAFDAVLAQARSAADLLWLRETGGKTFETPERRAQLEKTLRDSSLAIKDTSVRRHYAQEMRERANAFFGVPAVGSTSSRRPARQQDSRRAHRFFSAGNKISIQKWVNEAGTPEEGALRRRLVVLLSFKCPDVIDLYFDDFDTVKVNHPYAKIMKYEAIKLAGQSQKERENTYENLKKTDMWEFYEKNRALLISMGHWQLEDDVDIEDVYQIFENILHLDRYVGSIKHNRISELSEYWTRVIAEGDPGAAEDLKRLQAELFQESAPASADDDTGRLSGRKLRKTS